MIIIKCNHDIDQKIEIYIDNIKFPVIKNNIVSTLNFDNTKPVHNIRIVQYSVLNQKQWLSTLLNPARFFGYAVFRREALLCNAYDSDYAQTEFKVQKRGNCKEIIIEVSLKTKHINNDMAKKYYQFEVKNSKYIVGKVNYNLPVEKTYKFRWICVRILPTFIIPIFYLLIFQNHNLTWRWDIVSILSLLILVPSLFLGNIVVTIKSKSMHEVIKKYQEIKEYYS